MFNVARKLQLKSQPSKRKAPTTPPFENIHARPKSSSPYSRDQQDASAFGVGVVDFAQIQASLDLNRHGIDRLETAGHRAVTWLDKAIRHVGDEAHKLQECVQGLTKDIGQAFAETASLNSSVESVQGLVAKDKDIIEEIEAQVRSINDVIPNMRKNLEVCVAKQQELCEALEHQLPLARQKSEQLQALAQDNASTIKDQAEELTLLRREVSILKEAMNARNTESQTSKGVPSAVFPTRELDILTESIARVATRASLVDMLQMQFEMLKGRVERLEGSAHVVRTKDLNQTSSSPASPPSRLKKRPRGVDEQEEVENLEGVQSKTLKWTKSGKVDKRSLKGASR